MISCPFRGISWRLSWLAVGKPSPGEDCVQKACFLALHSLNWQPIGLW